MPPALRTRWRLPLAALFLAALLSAVQAWADWSPLSARVLPDTDDMMRLVQIRDWVDGQGFGDLVQHRLSDGASGILHWSRLVDLGPAALMITLRPLLGREGAEVWTAMVWPALLFAAYLLAALRLAIRAGGAALATPALVIAALAYPAITVFAPGRIDHHGLQIILVLLLVETLLRDPNWRAGALTGLLMAASLAIGLETAPEMLVALAVMFALWLRSGATERPRMLGFGCALLTATIIWQLVAQPDNWSPLWCDGFGPASFSATVGAGLAWLALAAAPASAGRRGRALIGLTVATTVLAVLAHTSAICISGPYAAVDPELRRLWLDHVKEAQGLVAHRGSLATLLGFGALPLLAMGASAVAWRRTRSAGWAVLLAFSAMAFAVTFTQIRGGPIAAALAIPALARLVAQARKTERPLPLTAGWLASVGLVWALIGIRVDRAIAAPLAAGGASEACSDPRLFATLRRLSPSTVVATIDVGPAIIALTQHRVLAAPYHRNNAGNRAAYDFWLQPEARARSIAARWQADYVLFCPRGLGDLDLRKEGPNGIAARVARGDRPRWLEPVALPVAGPMLFRVLPLARPSE